MVDHHIVAVGVVVCRCHHLPALARLDGGPIGGRYIRAGVAVRLAGNGVNPVTKGGSQPIVPCKRPQIAALRINGNILRSALRLQLLLLAPDLGIHLGLGLMLLIQQLVHFGRIRLNLVEQRLRLLHLGSLLIPLGLFLLPLALLLGPCALQVGLELLDLLAGRHQLIHNGIVVIHHVVDNGKPIQQIGKIRSPKQAGPVGDITVLLHTPHPLAEELILLLFPRHGLHSLSFLFCNLLVVESDLLCNIVQLLIDSSKLLPQQADLLGGGGLFVLNGGELAFQLLLTLLGRLLIGDQGIYLILRHRTCPAGNLSQNGQKKDQHQCNRYRTHKDTPHISFFLFRSGRLCALFPLLCHASVLLLT